MKIVVGTQNRAKIAACKNVFSKVYSDVEVVPVDADSGINAMPMNHQESVNGARNRVANAIKLVPDADLAVGLEGGVEVGPDGLMFLVGWVVIVNKDGKTGIGHSAGVALPADIAKSIRQGAELGPLMQKRLNEIDDNNRHTNGTSGILTDNMYGRVHEFEDAIITALAPFVAPEYFTL